MHSTEQTVWVMTVLTCTPGMCCPRSYRPLHTTHARLHHLQHIRRRSSISKTSASCPTWP